MELNEFIIDTRKMRYTGIAMAALKQSGVESNQRTHKKCEANIPDNPINDENSSCHLCSQRVWLRSELASRSPQLTTGRHIGTYALTTSIAPWVKRALTNYRPTAEVLELVRPFASKLHSLLDGERESSSGLHDLDAIEMSYQHSLEIGAAILLGVDTTDNPARGQNKFNERLVAFEALARSSVPTLDAKSELDRCFWRIALGYLDSMNACENARSFKTPKKAYIEHGIDADLVIAARALDTIGSAYMCRDGAAWLDDKGIDSLIGTALANDVMDLHTDVLTGETLNLLRSAQLAKKQPLGVSEDLAPVIRNLHDLWHARLLDDTKKPGWGREFDHMSDMLLGDAGEILASRGGTSEDMYKFAIAYGRLSMGLPYIAYHTIDAIIMTFGVEEPPSDSVG
ncbi:hypothetical protein GGS24DRAFT_501962 [Hypoxylon argillaceum]|nr:hypothetical protein GGS24DRAFT_501962 [Hypoxylon argillaceum]